MEYELRVDVPRGAAGAELVRPSVVPAGLDPVDLVVLRRAVLRLPDRAAGGVDADAEGVPQAHREGRVARTERVVVRHRAVGVQAQDLSAEVVHVLRA